VAVRGDCSAKAAQLLAGRPHFRAELAAKLARRGFPADEIAAALDRLEEQHYLDDRKAAADFVAHRRERGGESRLRLRAELVRRGAPPDAIEEALAGLGDEDDLAAARAIASRSKKDPAALARHLARRGFSGHAIVAALKEGPEGSAGFDEGVELDVPDEDTPFDEGFEPE
jgi:regulatory protein